MNKQKAEKIKEERLAYGTSFRSLALKYGLSYGRVYRMLNDDQESPKKTVKEEELPDDVKLLKALLRRERLKTELLNNIIDIADKELGTNIRKKSGTRRSE
jgi:hypothetical protein